MLPLHRHLQPLFSFSSLIWLTPPPTFFPCLSSHDLYPPPPLPHGKKPCLILRPACLMSPSCVTRLQLISPLILSFPCIFCHMPPFFFTRFVTPISFPRFRYPKRPFPFSIPPPNRFPPFFFSATICPCSVPPPLVFGDLDSIKFQVRFSIAHVARRDPRSNLPPSRPPFPPIQASETTKLDLHFPTSFSRGPWIWFSPPF